MKINLILAQDDNSFLFEVYASSRLDEMTLWGWGKVEQMQFLRMQFDCQQRSYRMQYPNLESKIILVDGVQAGRILTNQTNREMVVVDITLLPEFRNRGIGTMLLSQLQTDAQNVGLTLRLSVLVGSSAQRLYERLGFQTVDSSGVHTTMKWQPIETG